ncbi:MAG: hypothetical protein Q4D79_10600 [Propionibacteriaceae bacterium]|nr:hypothetical protein [Propionibacteriaceae bacterium]
MTTPRFTTALAGEIQLTRRRGATWLSLGIWALCLAVFAYLIAYLATTGSDWYSPEQKALVVAGMLPQGVAHYALSSFPLYGAPQLAILGAILGASDHACGTIRTIAARFPSRMPLATRSASSPVPSWSPPSRGPPGC